MIRQSEFRTVQGGNETYVRTISNSLSLMAGLDYLRYAPRRLDLEMGVNSPKATVSFVAPERSLLPTVSFSFGQAFFTNHPRTGDGSFKGMPVSRAHSYQLVVLKFVGATELRATFGRITQEASLAKIDADTGLQYDEGPSRNRYMTVAIRRRFGAGSLEASFSKADARGLNDGSLVPEAPRLIADAVGSIDRLPWKLRARGEFEYVGAKPLGDGLTGIPVREFRGRSCGQS